MIVIKNKVCKQCKLPFTTTSSVAVVHPECRKAYYASRGKGAREKKKSQYDLRARRRFFINEHLCEVCGYLLITKAREFYHADTNETKVHHLCPRCLQEFRLGFLEALTWKPIDLKTRENRVAAPIPVLATVPPATPK
jgi:hypothetical protein